MTSRLTTALAAGALTLAGCAHERATDEGARASAGPTTGGRSDPNAANEAASIRPQASPRTALPPSMTGTGKTQASPTMEPPTMEPTTEEPASSASPPAAPEAPASTDSPK